MDGWVKLHRCLLEKAIWQLNDAQRIVFFTILMLANFEPKQWLWNGKQFKAEPGQFVTSIDSLAKAARVSPQSVRTAINNLSKLDFLTSKSTKTGRLITVTNWASYQSDEILSTNHSTDDQQSVNKASTTTKNDKNVRMIRKNIYGSFQNVLLTEEEYERLKSEFDCAAEAVEYLSAYIAEKGYKSKSHNLAIRRWVIDAVRKKKPRQTSFSDLARGD